MTSAGSLFTSCIEQVEPLGIQDLRYAKAEYIRALKDLRAADAEYRRAEAAVQLAIARYEDALTAGVNADTEYQKLLNEYQKLVNQDYAGEVAYNEAERLAKLDSLQKAMEVRELNHKRELAEAEKDMRIAQEDLRVTIRNINLACGDLTANEKVAIYEAAAVYYYLLEESLKQDSVVKAAQIELAKAQERALRFTDTMWSSEQLALVNVYEWIQEQIEAEQAKIVFWQDKYDNLPDTSAAIAQWKEYMDAFDDEINGIKVKQAKIEANKVAYDALSKEAVRDFNMELQGFVEKWWKEKPTGTYTEPEDLDDDEKAFVAKGEPKAEDYLVLADTIEFPVLKNKGTKTYTRFKNLISEYFAAVPDPTSQLDYTEKVMEEKADKKWIIYADQDMREFILGDSLSTAGSQTYTFYNTTDDEKYVDVAFGYGLKGAISVLERKMVTEKGKEKNYQDSIKKYSEVWKLDGDTLAGVISNYATWKKVKPADQTKANGNVAYRATTDGYLYASYAPYKKAIDELKAANDAYAKQDSTNKADRAALLAAVAKLYEELSDIDGDVEINKADSVAILNAIQKFAEARTKYLPEDKTKYAKGANPHYFYFSVEKKLGEPVVDSVALSTIATQTKFPAVAYEYDKTCEKTNMDLATKPDERPIRRAIANILGQMFGVPTTAFNNASTISLNVPSLLTASVALIPGADKLSFVDDWQNPTTITYNGSPYEKTPSTTTINAKKALVDEAVTKYEDLYKKYWGASAFVPVASQKDPKGYFIESFTEPFPIVNFDDAQKIIWTNKGLNTVCDGIMENSKDGYTKDDLFGENRLVAYTMDDPLQSDLFRYMYWVDQDPINPDDLKEIKEWVAAVEAAFEADLQPDPDKLEAAKELYDELVAKAAAYQEYAAAKKAFTGTRVVDGDTLVNDVFGFTSPFVKGTDDPAPVKSVEDLFATNIVDRYVGWSDKVAGATLEKAKALFGDEPWEIFNDYNDEKAQYAQQIKELQALQKKAEAVYMAKAKVEGYRDAGTSGATAKTIKELYQDYVDAYEQLQKDLVVFDEFGNIETNPTIYGDAKINNAYHEIDRLAHYGATYESQKPDYDKLIVYLQSQLEIEQNRLKQIKDALKLAKENYDRIREYLLSQDGVSYVIPVSTADLDDAIMNIEYILRSLGHTIADVYSEVADKIGA